MFGFVFVAAYLLLPRVGLSVSTCQDKITTVAYEALFALYSKNNGNRWTWDPRQPNYTRWNFPSALLDPCVYGWQGISCTQDLISNPDGCVISQLVLSRFNMRFQLPDQLGNLTDLRVLNFQDNFLSGTVPATLVNLKRLMQIHLDDNDLTGRIPVGFEDSSSLFTFSLTDNYISGSIPHGLWFVPSLDNLYLSGNLLTGQLPSNEDFGLVSNIDILEAATNYLTGSLSLGIQSMLNITIFKLDVNLLTGSLPEYFGQFTKMAVLGLNENRLTGTIPSIIFAIGPLQQVYVGDNRMHGTLPTEFGKALGLETIAVYGNSFTGSIPTEIGHLILLQYFGAYSNSLTGPLPSDFSNLLSLEAIYVDENALTGPISNGIAALPALNSVGFDSNQFTGTIPSQFGSTSSISTFSVQENYFSGVLPTTLVQISALQYLFLYSNHLTGSIPSEYGQFVSLLEIDVSCNQLTGTLPNQLGSLGTVNHFNVGFNSLHGTLPRFLRNFTHLTIMNLSANEFVGNLNGVFDNTTGLFRRLEYIDLSRNQLDGTMPRPLFELPVLHAVALFSNCFTGSIPSSICSSVSLKAVVLDGLSTSSQCLISIPAPWNTLVRGLFASRLLRSQIPNCIWQMPNLTTLHLSGNGLTGSIPEIPESSSLTDINLANNYLSGTLPLSLQKLGKLQQLDLSSNKFNGTLSNEFAVSNTSTVLDLSVNRLSGELPESFMEAPAINVLTGNLFNCQSDNMPKNDPQSEYYVCGSNDFNDSLIVWLVIAIALVMLGVFIYILRKAVTSPNDSPSSKVANEAAAIKPLTLFDHLSAAYPTLKNWLDTDFTHLEKCNVFLDVIRSATRTIGILTVFYIVVCLTTYIVLKESSQYKTWFSTHEYQYAWVTSAAYLHGETPAIIISIYLIVSMLYVCHFFLDFSTIAKPVLDPIQDKLSEEDRQRSQSQTSSNSRSNWMENLMKSLSLLDHFMIPLGYQLLNVLMTLVINGSYVVAIFHGLSETQLVFIQLFLSLYKISWNSTYVPWAIRHMKLSYRIRMRHQVFMNIFTYVVGPMCATVVTDSNCLYYAILGQSPVSSTYVEDVHIPECVSHITLDGTTCRPYPTENILTTVLTPPWLYSYQCSSAVFQNYIPVLVFVYTFSGLITPFVRCLVILTPESFFETKIGHYMKIFLKGTIMTPSLSESDRPSSISDISGNSRCSSNSSSKRPSDINVLEEMRQNSAFDAVSPLAPARLLENRIHPEKLDQNAFSERSSSGTGLLGLFLLQRHKRLFRACDVVSKRMLDFAVMLTFGLASPLLAVTVAVTNVNNLILWQLLLGRYVRLSESSSQQIVELERLEYACNGAYVGLKGSLLIIIVIVGLFWCLIMFDMVADDHGDNAGGLMVLLIAIVVPVFVILTFLVRIYGPAAARHATKYFQRTNNRQDNNPVFRESETAMVVM